MFKDILTFLGLDYRDSSLITLYLIVIGISNPKIRSVEWITGPIKNFTVKENHIDAAVSEILRYRQKNLLCILGHIFIFIIF